MAVPWLHAPIASVLSLVLASALADDNVEDLFAQLFAMPMTRTTISFTREGMQLIQEAAKRQGSSVSQFVREAALMRATMAADDNPYPMRALAAQLRAIGDQGYALAEKALNGRRGGDRSEAVRPDTTATSTAALLEYVRPSKSSSLERQHVLRAYADQRGVQGKFTSGASCGRA